jgi:hypothetical protein
MTPPTGAEYSLTLPTADYETRKPFSCGKIFHHHTTNTQTDFLPNLMSSNSGLETEAISVRNSLLVHVRVRWEKASYQ